MTNPTTTIAIALGGDDLAAAEWLAERHGMTLGEVVESAVLHEARDTIRRSAEGRRKQWAPMSVPAEHRLPKRLTRWAGR